MHGLSYNTTQDEQGVLHFAGTMLLSFDGERWRGTPLRETYALRRLKHGADGRIWAGGIGELGWYERRADGTWGFHSLRDRLAEADRNFGDVWGVHVGARTTTFITTERIFRWDGQDLRTWELRGQFRLSTLPAEGHLYIDHHEQGILRLDDDGPHLVIPRSVLGSKPGNMVDWMERAGERWLLGSSEGFYYCDGKSMVPFAPALTPFLQSARLICAQRLPDRRIAVGTMRGGIVFLHEDGSLDRHLGEREGLPSLYISSLFLAQGGRDLWATSGSHIMRIDLTGRTTVLDEHAGLPRQTVRAVTRAQGRIVAANEGGVFELDEATGRFQAIPGLDGRWTHLRDSPGGLVAAGFHGASRWTPGRAETFLPSGANFFLTAPSRRHPGETLFSENWRIAETTPEGARTRVDELPDNVTSLVEDESGRLWLGMLARGLWVAEPVETAAVRARSTAGQFGLPALEGQTHVRRGADGTIAVVANNGAWIRPSGAAAFEPVADYRRLTVATVGEMAPDGGLWVIHSNTSSHPSGAGRITRDGSGWRWQAHAVDALDAAGAPRSLFVEVVDGETVLWIGGFQGLLRHRVGAKLEAPVPAAPLLRARHRDPQSGLTHPLEERISYSAGAIEFELAAPEYARRHQLRIETRIDGIDAGWLPAGRDSRRELTALRDGRYTMRARVVAETGAAGPEARCTFTVDPPWWRTRLALAGGAILLAAGIYAGLVLRLRALRRRNAELETKVRERTEALEKANAAKTQFVANMSHDIRNPLNGIVGLAIALENSRLEPRQRELVATLRECTAYLSTLVDDVLDFASIEAGRLELRPAPFAPRELLRSIVAMMTADAGQSGASLQIDAAADVPVRVLADAGRIQQILVNFVSNALKYAGGEVRLSVSLPAATPGEIEFAVTDRGPGIDAAGQEKLFLKFSRLQQAHGGEPIPGKGLGLAACRLLADVMGGGVGVHSRPGEGSRFFLRLPLLVATGGAEQAASPLPNSTILLVEDTDYNAWAAEAVLARLGLACERARTGAEALQRFGARRFNVVLLDRNLPDMDGTEVARQLRKLEGDGARAVLLAVTAYCTAADRDECIQAGMDAFLGKPLTPDKLRAALLSAGRESLVAPSIQATPNVTGSPLDLSLLEYLAEGSPDGLDAQVRRFLASLEEARTELETAFRQDRAEARRNAAHQLLGPARMVGATALTAAAEDLEAAVRDGDPQLQQDLLGRVRREIRLVTAAVLLRRPSARSE